VCSEEVHEFGLRGLEAQGAQRDAQLVVVEVAVAVKVEEVELFAGMQSAKQNFNRAAVVFWDIGRQKLNIVLG
jgi:hypothetical protein